MLDREKGPKGHGCMTLPVKDIDLVTLVEHIFANDVTPETSFDIASTVATAAVSFAIECMANAMGKLALRVDAKQGEVNFAGWDVTQLRNHSGNAFSMTISRKNLPGAWNLGVQFEPMLSEAGALARQKLEDERGPESMDDRIRRILNTDPAEALFEANTENFRPSKHGDMLKKIAVTALKTSAGPASDMTAPPPGVSSKESMAISEFNEDPFRFEGSWSGCALTMRPARKAESRNDETKWKTSCSGWDCVRCFTGLEFLFVMSQIITDAGLRPAVRAELNHMLPRRLWSSLDQGSILHEEIGIASVRDGGGLVSKKVLQVIEDIMKISQKDRSKSGLNPEVS